MPQGARKKGSFSPSNWRIFRFHTLVGALASFGSKGSKCFCRSWGQGPNLDIHFVLCLKIRLFIKVVLVHPMYRKRPMCGNNSGNTSDNNGRSSVGRHQGLGIRIFSLAIVSFSLGLLFSTSARFCVFQDRTLEVSPPSPTVFGS